jgi:hypothetical protein
MQICTVWAGIHCNNEVTTIQFCGHNFTNKFLLNSSGSNDCTHWYTSAVLNAERILHHGTVNIYLRNEDQEQTKLKVLLLVVVLQYLEQI